MENTKPAIQKNEGIKALTEFNHFLMTMNTEPGSCESV